MEDPKQQTEAGQPQAGEFSAEDSEKISGGGAGIDALIAVTQVKVDNANNAAMQTATPVKITANGISGKL